ncbi:MAG: wax ester/triacylglycerol synthase family O-acyltransferase [Mycobacteriaceae bacterium]
MVVRLSPADTAFYQRENTSTPMYVGSLSILRRPRGGLSYERLLETVERQLPMVPRYRQKVREVTFGLARPVWVDDPDFDVTYHVRRSALPSPGSDSQLHELVSRLAGRPLDRTRPLWEMYLIEGLSKNRLAVFIKSHQALVNGLTALELGHVIADRNRRPPPAAVEDIWLPKGVPSAERLLIDAVGDWLARPGQELRSLRSTVVDVATNAGELAQIARRTAQAARRMARGSAPQSPLNTTVSRHRRFTVASAELADYRTVRARYDCDVNDVVLTVIAGALRNWLLSRGEPVPATSVMRAMAPTSVYPEAEPQSGPGQAISEVAPFLIELPVGESNPVVRLSQIAHATETHSAATSLVDAQTIVTLSGFPPPTLHAMGTRVATAFSPRQFNLLITNVPGPQSQMYVAGAKVLETYAVPPLLHDQVLAIGVTSYCGMLYFGINADRDAMTDVEVLPELLAESLEELLEAATT